MPGNIRGKVIIITGGTTGIGKAVAKKFAENGAAVVLAGRDSERGATVIGELSGNGAVARFIQTDVTQEVQVIQLVKETIDTFGGIDFLFNNAGVEGMLGDMSDNTVEVINEVLDTNIKGVFLCMKHVLPAIVQRGGGVIVNTASFVGTIVPFPNAIIYGASKAAVLSMTASVAAGCTENNVQVFAVCPWVTDTPMVDRLTGFQQEAKASFGSMINPTGKIATTDDISQAVLSLFTNQQGLNNGEAILADSNNTISRIIPMSF